MLLSWYGQAALALKAVAGRIYHAKIPEASNGGKAEGAASGNGKQQEGAGGVANGDGPRVNPAWKALGYDDRTMEQMIKTNGVREGRKPRRSGRRRRAASFE